MLLCIFFFSFVLYFFRICRWILNLHDIYICVQPIHVMNNMQPYWNNESSGIFFSFHLYKQNDKLTTTHNIRRCYILFVFDYKIPICITECACRTVCIVQSFWYSVYLHIFIYIYVCVFLIFVCVEYLHIIWLQRNKFVCALVSDIMRVLIRTELIFAIFNALWFILHRLS